MEWRCNMIKSLEKEFQKYSELHSKMVFALALANEPSIYNHSLLKGINTHPELNKKERVSRTLDEITKLKGQQIFNDIYELCWLTAKEFINNKGIFSNRIY